MIINSITVLLIRRRVYIIFKRCWNSVVLPTISPFSNSIQRLSKSKRWLNLKPSRYAVSVRHLSYVEQIHFNELAYSFKTLQKFGSVICWIVNYSIVFHWQWPSSRTSKMVLSIDFNEINICRQFCQKYSFTFSFY